MLSSHEKPIVYNAQVDRAKQLKRDACFGLLSLLCLSAVRLYCFHENDGKVFSISNKSENTIEDKSFWKIS